MDVLQRLVVLSTQLAELAVRQAVEESQTPAEPPTTEPPRPRRADPQLIFLRLSREIRAAITLKIRLAAGLLPGRPRPEPPPRPAPEPAVQAAPSAEDPRRPHILRYFRETIDLTRQKRKTPITQQHIEDRVDTELARDPQHKLAGCAVLRTICKSLDLPFYASRMPPDLLRPPRANASPP